MGINKDTIFVSFSFMRVAIIDLLMVEYTCKYKSQVFTARYPKLQCQYNQRKPFDHDVLPEQDSHCQTSGKDVRCPVEDFPQRISRNVLH